MKLIKWMAFHRVLARWIALGLVFLFTFALTYLNIPILILMIIYFGLMFIAYTFVEAYPPIVMQKKAINILHQSGDPFPLLHISEELLSSDLNTGTKSTVIINYCVALRNIGEYEKAYGYLNGLDIDNMPKSVNINKLVCYNNLADLCIFLERFDEALEYHNKFDEIYKTFNPKKLDPVICKVAKNHEIDRCYIKGDYQKALDILNHAEPKNHEEKINNALYTAKICLKLGDMEKARENLNYVISNGNRLFAVVEAKKMLDNM